MATSLKAYLFDVEDNTGPRAIITPDQQRSVVGSVAKMDGRASFDTATNPSGILNFRWSFVRTPIGSQVELEGFTSLDPDDAVVSFAPDVPGLYEVQLIVDDGSIDSPPFVAAVDVSVIAVPNNQGIVPDASFIWNYLSDFWSLVEDKEKFEVIWSAIIQVASAELIKLYQYDYNKSIRDIQRFFQKRWLDYSPALVFDRTQVTAILADDQAGLAAATNAIDPLTGIVEDTQEDFFNLITVPTAEGSFSQTPYGLPIATGRLITMADQSFTMARSNNSLKAVNEGDDGITSIGTDLFQGSGFDVSYEGYHLIISSGADAGTYLIDTVDSDTDLRLTDFEDPPAAVSFSAAAADLDYSVVPGTTNISNFFADQKIIPTKTFNQPWRFSSTLSTTEYDLELEGVLPGDVLEVEVTRTDLNLTGILRCQVVGSDRDKLSFVFNTEDLEDGVASTGLSESAQESLADSLQVTGLSRDVNGVLQYSLEAEAVRDVISSVSFRRSYFETAVSPDTVFDLGPFSVRLRPLRVLRNTKMKIDTEILSVPMLQEYIRQPDLAELDGVLQVVGRNGKLHPIDHTPYVLSENLDYIIDDEATISGLVNLIQNDPVLEIPRGDLVDRSVQPGDELDIQVGSVGQTYTIRRVLTPEKVQVFPTPSTTISGAAFVLRRRIEGRFIRFTQGVFTKDSPAPLRLWAELTYFSNDENIEANFGALVGVRRDDINQNLVQAPYKSIVEGLMFALTNGPIHENLRLAAQILLGLPFAQKQGEVIEINKGWRIREDGSPLYDRMLIEGRDKDGNTTGVTNAYLIPRGRQLADPDNPGEWLAATPNESGIALNPSTGEEYVVGDFVEQFAVLSKGVEIEDYLSDTTATQTLVEQGNISAFLTQYHSFQLKINSDVATTADIDLATSFIRQAKPSYARIFAGILRVIEDFVTVEDALIFGRELGFYEAIGLGLPVAIKADQGSGDDDYLSVEGVMYAKYLRGLDLVTTQGSNQVTSASGGFITAPSGQSYDSPFLRSGDLLVIADGDNQGEYDISSVDSDTAVTVVNGGTFSSDTAQEFRVYRPVQNPIFSGSFDISVTDPEVSAPAGLFSAGVSVGDTFVFHGGALNMSRRYTITKVDPSLQEIRIDPAPVEASGTYTGVVRRDGLEEKYFGYGSTDQPHTANWTTGDNKVVFVPGSSDLDILSFLRPGDVLEADSRPGILYTIIDTNPSALTAWVLPSPDFTAASDPTRPSRPNKGLVPVSVDLLDHIPEDYLVLEQRLPGSGGDLVTTAGSADVTTGSGEDFDALGVRPGDFLVILEDGDSNVDVGYGDGIYPIQELVTATTLRLTRTLAVNSGVGGLQYGIQKRDAL
jgi:hypothetical protein